MAFLLSNRRIVFVAAGAGMLFGSCAIWYYIGRRLSNRIASLTLQVELLKREVDRLRSLVEGLMPPKPLLHHPIVNVASVQNFSSIPTSDDDDVYEEAYGGPLPWLTELGVTALKSGGDSQSITSDDYLSANSYSSLDDDITALLYSKADRLFEGSDRDKREAYEMLKQKKSQLSRDVNFVWRLAKATYFMSQIEGPTDKEEGKSLVYAAKDLAFDALQLDENNCNAHKWFAISLGSTNDYESVAVKIQNGYEFKKHIERAIELNPTDPTGHYLLGRWSFGVYQLSWVERKMATALFATPPSATIEESLSEFLEADRLNPGKWKENLLFIAKCYIEQRDYYSAADWLYKANELPIAGQDDETSQQEVSALLKQYGSYRT